METHFHSIEIHYEGRSILSYKSHLIPAVGDYIYLPKSIQESEEIFHPLRIRAIAHKFYDAWSVNQIQPVTGRVVNYYIILNCAAVKPISQKNNIRAWIAKLRGNRQ